MKGLDLIPLVPRLFNARRPYVGYLEKTLWPLELSPLYPHPGPGLSLGAVVVSLGAASRAHRRGAPSAAHRPWLAVGWLWYLGTLLPVIGIVQVGWQAMADRYTYLPLIGVFLAACWEGGRARPHRRTRRIATGAALVLLAGPGRPDLATNAGSGATA